MECQHDVRPGLQPELIPACRFSKALHICKQGVDHRVPDKEDLAGQHTAALKILVRRRRRREEVVRDGIGDDAIDLFGHRPVARANPPSTCATRTPSFCAAMAQAMVDVTSPTTRQRSAGESSSSRSYRVMIAAVCSACVPEPTSRFTAAPESRAARRNRPTFERRSAVPCARVGIEPDPWPIGVSIARRIGGDLHEIRAGARNDVDSHATGWFAPITTFGHVDHPRGRQQPKPS